MASSSSWHNREENGGEHLLQEIGLLRKAMCRKRDESNTKLAGGGGSLLQRVGQVGNVLGRKGTRNIPLSQICLTNIGFEHSTASAILGPLEQGKKWDSRQRLSSTRRHGAGKSIDFDEKSAPRAIDLASCPQLRPSRSSVEGKNMLSIDNFPKWLEDNMNFSKKMEASIGKKSLWNWKPIRVLARIWQQRFSCIFWLQVHRIEGLPQAMDGLCVSVHWRRRGGGEQTVPARVAQGVAHFEETLQHNCTIYGRKSPDGGIRYEPKLSSVYVTASNASGQHLGKRQLDLSRLLPELIRNTREDVKPHNWATSFKLEGKASGGTLVVTLRSKIVNKELSQMGQKGNRDVDIPHGSSKQSIGKHRNSTGGAPQVRHSEAPVSRPVPEPDAALHPKNHWSLDDLSSTALHPKTRRYFQQSEGSRGRSLAPLLDFRPKSQHVPQNDPLAESSDFSCQGPGRDEQEDSRLEDGIKATVVNKEVEMDSDNVLQLPHERGEENCSKPGEGEEKTEEGLNSIRASQSDTFEPALEYTVVADELVKPVQDHQEGNGSLDKACDTEDELDLVEDEFLSMLEVDHHSSDLSSDGDPVSSSACLLRQFERESLLAGRSSIGFEFSIPSVSSCTEVPRSSWGSAEDLGLASIIEAGESELQKADQALRSKMLAKMIEDEETQILMQKWDLNENALQNSPPDALGGFGSPINVPLLGPAEQPTFAEGLDSVVKTKHGGLLRSIRPQSFHYGKGKGSLIMQASKPLVMPAETSSNVMDIFHSLTSNGTEKFTVQAQTMMPLEDITGKTIQQVDLEAGHLPEGSKQRQTYIQDLEADMGSECSFAELSISRKMHAAKCKSEARNCTQGPEMPFLEESHGEYVSLEEVVSLTMEKIEALVIEGLKIQSGMSDQDSPSNVSPMLAVEMPSLEGKRVKNGGILGSPGTASLQISDDSENYSNVDDLMAWAVTLDDWVQLDAGIGKQEEASERISKVADACHAAHSELICGGHHKGGKGKAGSQRYGIEQWDTLGNSLTIGLLVQLHDPFWNCEPVGAPMMTLIQVERVVLPAPPKTERKVSKRGNGEPVEERKYQMSQFKITGVHVAGLKSWSTPKQQESGSHWLIANGMGRGGEHTQQKLRPEAKSTHPPKTNVRIGETLWSISAPVHCSGEKWRQAAVLNVHVRNPDIIFPDETIDHFGMKQLSCNFNLNE